MAANSTGRHAHCLFGSDGAVDRRDAFAVMEGVCVELSTELYEWVEYILIPP